MFTRALRKSLKRQEGQALVLACLTVLILSIAVITTVNLGHTVHEKIRLQNTADAAAYSMAAMEARAFNFYAFANRTQASQYVNAMNLHSAISFLFFIEAFVIDMYGVIKSLTPCADTSNPIMWALCRAIEAVPVVGPIFATFNQFAGRILDFIERMIPRVFKVPLENIDKFIGRTIIPNYRYLQAVMAGASTAMMYSTATHLIDTSFDIIEANDKNVGTSLLGQLGAGALASCMFNRAHYAEANGNLLRPKNPVTPLDVTAEKESDKTARAKRAMGQIANATRYACESKGACPELFITSRTFSDVLQIPNWLRPVRFLLDDWVVHKWGQTRFLGYRAAEAGTVNRGRPTNWIHSNQVTPNKNKGPLGSGDNIGGDDLYSLSLGPDEISYGVGKLDNPFNCKEGDDDPVKCHGDPNYDQGSRGNKQYGKMFKTSVWAMNDQEGTRNDGGVHFRVQYRTAHTSCRSRACGFINARRYNMAMCDDMSDIGLNCFKHEVISAFGLSLDIPVYYANVRRVEDGNHPWPGLSPFAHFEPGQYASACPGFRAPSETQAANRAREFNQPSTFVALNKTAAELRNPNADATATRNDPALLNSSGTINFALGAGGGTTLEMENKRMTMGVDPFTLEGISVVSRAQAYYHRPGNWTEQPNFFNPYWRPRLASVWQGKYAIPVVQQITDALPAQISNVPQKIITH